MNRTFIYRKYAPGKFNRIYLADLPVEIAEFLVELAINSDSDTFTL